MASISDIIDVSKLKRVLEQFAVERDWQPYHTPKNVSMALAVEASELLEIFQWMTPQESVDVLRNTEQKEKVAHELSDIILYAVRMADLLNINLQSALTDKILINEQKYPAEKVKGSAKKYTEYSQ